MSQVSKLSTWFKQAVTSIWCEPRGLNPTLLILVSFCEKKQQVLSMLTMAKKVEFLNIRVFSLLFSPDYGALDNVGRQEVATGPEILINATLSTCPPGQASYCSIEIHDDQSYRLITLELLLHHLILLVWVLARYRDIPTSTISLLNPTLNFLSRTSPKVLNSLVRNTLNSLRDNIEISDLHLHMETSDDFIIIKIHSLKESCLSG